MTDWPLDRTQRRALDRRIDLLRKVDRQLAVGSIVFKVKGGGIYKIKVKGNLQLRPRLCFGPAIADAEVTFLQRVEKKDGRERPTDAAERAVAKRKEILADPSRRTLI